MGNWISTLLLPGILPATRSYMVGSTLVTPADPNWLDLGADFPDGSQSYGSGTPYQMPMDRHGAMSRAWRTKGWNTFQLTSEGQYTPRSPSGCTVQFASDRFSTAGAIYNDYGLPGSTVPPGIGPGGDSLMLSGYFDISCATPSVGDLSPLDPPSWGVWSAISGGTATGGPDDVSAGMFNPSGAFSYLYGRNKRGNFATPLGATIPAADLDWTMRLDAGDMAYPYAPSVVIARLPLPIPDPTYPFFRNSDLEAARPYTPGVTTPPVPIMVPHSIVIRASAYGNAGVVRYGSGGWQYPALFWFTVSATIEPDPMDGVDFSEGIFGVVELDTDLDFSYISGQGGMAIASTLASNHDADISRPYYYNPIFFPRPPSGLSLYADGMAAMSGIEVFNISDPVTSGTGSTIMSDFNGIAAWVDFVPFRTPAGV